MLLIGGVWPQNVQKQAAAVGAYLAAARPSVDASARLACGGMRCQFIPLFFSSVLYAVGQLSSDVCGTRGCGCGGHPGNEL